MSSRCMLLLTVYIKQRTILPYFCAKHSIVRRTIPGKEYSSNYEFTSFVLSIQDTIVTGDFNYNMLSTQSSSKIKSICEQFSFTQTIKTPTHFTEHSSSLIDIILTNNETHLLYSEVGDPFLNQEVRYHHCPVFGIPNFTKPKHKSYLRHTLS